LNDHAKATEREFIVVLKELYSQPFNGEDMVKKFPNFMIDLENWLKTLK
jgi:hypothetical protein